MIVRRKKNKGHICGFCEAYTQGIAYNGGRSCSLKGCHKTHESEACEDFHLTKIFYCKKRNMSMDTVACNAIRKTKRKGNSGKVLSPEQYKDVYSMCYEKCDDGKIIESFFIEEPTIILRRRKMA